VLAQNLHTKTIVRAVPEMITAAVEMAGKTSDNVTALAMTWESNDAEHDPASSSISTHTLPIGSVTTTIQTGTDGDPVQADAFNEGDIEKAIEEIRHAIEKSSNFTPKS